MDVRTETATVRRSSVDGGVRDATTPSVFGTPESASANSDLEWADSAVSFVYRNTSTGDLSLVVILDEVNDGTGGETDVVVTGSGFGSDG